MDILSVKKELRKEAKTYRKCLTENERLDKSTRIIKNLKEINSFVSADVILMYASLPGEVETLRCLEELLTKGEQEIYSPVVHGEEMEFYRIFTMNDLKEGNFHVLEPKACEEMLLKPVKGVNYCMIVPGLMFDKHGNRLGFGKGYYDKYLARLSSEVKITTIALSYEDMVKNNIPAEETDKRVDYIVTEINIYEILK